MKSIKNFKSMKVEVSTSTVTGGKRTRTKVHGERDVRVDRGGRMVKYKTRVDLNPFNND